MVGARTGGQKSSWRSTTINAGLKSLNMVLMPQSTLRYQAVYLGDSNNNDMPLLILVWRMYVPTCTISVGAHLVG